jgi:hypothetical protein
MAFICAMTLTSCDEIMSKMDNPVDSYLKVDAEVFVKEGSAVELYAETISDAEVTYTVGDEKIAKVEKVSNHEVKVIGVKPGETVIDVKLAANAYYKAGEAKVKVSHIHYLYEEERDAMVYKAEEWITDRYGLNRKQNKLARVSGKFRRKTIDRIDYIFARFNKLLNNE